MAAVAFNSVEFATKLEEAGVEHKQAAAIASGVYERDRIQAEQAQALSALQAKIEVLEVNRRHDSEQMSTKSDVVLALKEIELVRKDMTSEFALVRKDMEALGNKLIIRLTLAMLGVVGVVGTIVGVVLRAMLMK